MRHGDWLIAGTSGTGKTSWGDVLLEWRSMGIATEGGAAGDSDGDGHGWEAAGAWISDAAARSGTAADGAADRTAVEGAGEWRRRVTYRIGSGWIK